MKKMMIGLGAVLLSACGGNDPIIQNALSGKVALIDSFEIDKSGQLTLSTKPWDGSVATAEFMPYTTNPSAIGSTPIATDGSFKFNALPNVPNNLIVAFAQPPVGCTSSVVSSDSTAKGMIFYLVANFNGQFSTLSPISLSADKNSYTVWEYIYSTKTTTLSGIEDCKSGNPPTKYEYKLSLQAGWNIVSRHSVETWKQDANGDYQKVDVAVTYQGSSVPSLQWLTRKP